MNLYEYQYMIKEQKRLQNQINREAWKYTSGDRKQKAFLKVVISVFKTVKNSFR